MTPYRVEIGDRALRELRGLPRFIRERLEEALDDLAVMPRPPGAKKLGGGHGWRIRKGDHRILYVVDDGSRLVRIYRIGNRRDIYRGL